MKKTTRVLSLLAALAMSAATVTSIAANADAGIILTQDEVMTKYIIDEELSELGITAYYTKVKENGETGGLYKLDIGAEGMASINTVEIKYNRFFVTPAEYNSFVIYMEENFPDYEIETYSNIHNDNKEVVITNYIYSETYDENLAFASKIWKDTGVSGVFYIYEDTASFSYNYIGDLSSDNALTPVDASMLLSYYADAQSGVAVASAESGVDYSIIGDFNGDGAVTPTDASEILSYYADQQTA